MTPHRHNKYLCPSDNTKSQIYKTVIVQITPTKTKKPTNQKVKKKVEKEHHQLTPSSLTIENKQKNYLVLKENAHLHQMQFYLFLFS